ncbi:MAG: hypothetical protein HY040_21305 [Planctomycetes bacterium]|nr:hypothetical protein [Planctomycetota bacterium]
MIEEAILRGRVRTVEDAVGAWEARHDNSEPHKLQRGARDIVNETLSMLEWMERVQDAAWKDLRAGKIVRVLERGRDLKRTFDAASKAAVAVGEMLASAEECGYALSEASEFRKRADRLQQLQARFEEKWPFPKKNELEASVASFGRGEGIDLGEWISELQGKNPAERPI